MLQLPSFLSESSVLKNYISGEESCIAIKGNSHIFSATLNVVKVGPIYREQNFFRILNLSSCAPFLVHLISLNYDESLLAVAGDHSLVIVDVKTTIDFDSAEPVWDCFNVKIVLPETSGETLIIKSILWHPACSRNSELVILTDKEILLYDIVYSLTQPMLVLPIKSFDHLNGKLILSIAFGSTENFAGSITLYLSTNCGNIFAIFPFTHESTTLNASKKQLSKFVNDWRACFRSYESRLPPSIAFILYRSIFSKHSALVDSIESKLNSPMYAEASEEQFLSVKIEKNILSPELIGPLATLGPDLKLIQTSPNADLLILAGIHAESTGNITITHLSQIIPLTLQFQSPNVSLSEPLKPMKKRSQEKGMTYSKPVRGFGYVIDSDDDEGQDIEDFQLRMQEYHNELDLHNVKHKMNAFIDANFNKLTVLSTDSTDFQYAANTKNLFQSLCGSKFLIALQTSLIIGDLGDTVSTLFSTTPVPFEVLYKLIESKYSSTNFAYVQDTIEGSGSYLIACSSLGETCVYQVEDLCANQKKALPQPREAISKEKPHLQTRCTTLPAAELKLIKADGGIPLEMVADIDLSNFESLKPVHLITSDLIRKVGSLTKFILALQLKIELQFEDLKSQAKDLVLVNQNATKNMNYFEDQKRIDKMIERQKALIQRAQAMRQKIAVRFESVRAKQKPPLSSAERDWFSELNSITKIVDLGDDSTPSMRERVEAIKADVVSLNNWKNIQAPEENLNDLLSSLLFEGSLSKAAQILAIEGQLLEQSKASVTSCLSRLQDAM